MRWCPASRRRSPFLPTPGVPVTHRGLATSFTVVTGHSRHAVDRDTNWEALAAAGGTLVVLMGVAHRAAIASRLLAAGMAAATPVLAVRWGTRSEQRSIRIRLDELGATPLEPPVTLVVGPVAGLELDWYERRPLFGRQWWSPGPDHKPARSPPCFGTWAPGRSRCRPSASIRPPTEARAWTGPRRELAKGRYDWVVFSSANAVEALLARLRDARSFGPARIAAIGPGTADALAQWRLTPDLMPARAVAEGLLEAFPDPPRPGSRVLIRELRPGGTCCPMGWPGRDGRSTPSPPTRPSAVSATPAERNMVAGADAVCFASASAVNGFLAAVGGPGARPARDGVHRSHHRGRRRGGGRRRHRRRRGTHRPRTGGGAAAVFTPPAH